ncbi:MAG: CHASE2 domain-containing protein [Phycisphaerae bacterium]
MTARRVQTTGIVLGLGVAILAAAAALRFGETLERMTLDLRFWYTNGVAVDPRIVHVDIDDGSVERVGRWPWDRDVLADLLRTLDELGASLIVVDLLLDNPQPYRLDLAGADIRQRETLTRVNEQNVRWPDLELADAVRRSGKVILGTHFDLRARGDRLSARQRVGEWLDRPGGATAEQVATGLRLSQADAAQLLLGVRATRVLTERFALDETACAARLAEPIDALRPVFAGAKRRAARALAAKLLERDPAATPVKLNAAVLPDLAPGTISPDTDDLAGLAERDLRVLHERTALPGSLAGTARVAVDVIALEELGARRPGWASWCSTSTPTAGCATCRCLPGDGRLIKQLGFAAACRRRQGCRTETCGWTATGGW